MRVLVFAPWVPHPDIGHAGGLLVLGHTRELAALCDVSLVAPTHEGVTTIEGIDLVPIAINVPGRGLRRRLRYLRWLARGLGPGPQELDGLRRFLRSPHGRRLTAAADVVEVHFEDMLPILDDLDRRSRVVLWAHDVVSEDLIVAQVNLRSRRRRVESRVRLVGTLRAERRLLPQCDAAVVFKAADQDSLRSLGFTGPLRVASPRIFPSTPDVETRPLSAEPIVVIVAAFDRAVNREGLMWFVSRVWPGVRDRVPTARLVVVGAHAPSVTVEGVKVVGFVPDLSSVYAEADVAVVPARGGAGLKFTVAQALTNGVPVVSTTSGARGYPSPDDAVFLVRRDDPDGFAAAVVEILNAPDRGRAAGAAGRAWWRAEDASRAGAGALVEWYSDLARNGGADG